MAKSKTKPIVSIITPNFNGKEYLEKTIKSVIKQTYKNIEYIIIDGGSKDGSTKIIKKYKKFIDYFESKKDNGIFHAVHKGIIKSKGKYILWINSDDILHPNAAENIVKIIRLFKQKMAPVKSDGNLFLKSPDTWRIKYLHSGKNDHKFLNKFKECALNGFGVNYTPSGQYSTYEDGVMTSYQVTMGFQELEPVYNDDYGNSTFPEEIGF